MKCTSKVEYECLYLDRDNVEEFIDWFKSLNNIYDYTFNDEYLDIVAYGKIDEEYDHYKFNYDQWYVFKNGIFYSYNPKYFVRCYNVVDDN